MKDQQFRKYWSFLGSLLLVLISAGPRAADSTIAQRPLYLSTVSGKPNIVLMVDNSGSMSNTVPAVAATATTPAQAKDTRMNIAKNAAVAMVNKLKPMTGADPTVRMGLAVYRSTSDGGRLLYPLADLNAAQATKLIGGINGLTASTATPLATTLLDIGYYYTYGNNTGRVTLHPKATPALAPSTIDSVFRKKGGTAPLLGPVGFDFSQGVVRICESATIPVVPENCEIPADGTGCRVNGTAYTPQCPPANPPNYISGGAPDAVSAGNIVTYPPIQMLVVGSKPTFCTGDSPNACLKQSNFDTCPCSSGLSACQTCQTNITGNEENISYTQPINTTTPTVLSSAPNPHSTKRSVPSTSNISNGGIQQLTASVNPSDPNNTGSLLSFTTNTSTVCSLRASNSGTTPCAAGSANCYISGTIDGVCRICTQYAGSTGGGQSCTLGGVVGGVSCDVSQKDKRVCPGGWNDNYCASLTNSDGGYYIRNNTKIAIPLGSISSCNNGWYWSAYNWYPCVTCSCWSASTCTSTSNHYCSNGQTSQCSNNNCCSNDSDCYTATCNSGLCSNHTAQTCTSDAGCYDNSCVSLKLCSNNNSKSCTADSNCYTNTCDLVGECTNNRSKYCNTASDCPTTNNTCNYNNKNRCSVSNAQCVVLGMSCGVGNGTCSNACSNDSNQSCTSNAACNVATCDKSSGSTHHRCSNDINGSYCGNTVGLVAACNSGVSCGSIKRCDNDHTISCTTLGKTSECNLSTACNKTCSDTGAACTDPSSCDANDGVTCNNCTKVTNPPTCTCNTGAGAACVVDTLDIGVGTGVLSQCADSTDTGGTGGQLNGAVNRSFDPTKWYTLQYNGGDLMGPYRGDQLNWYFEANAGFTPGTLQLPVVDVADINCTTPNAPIQNACQKSFAILITDGLPNGDRTVSEALRDYTGDCATKHLCNSTDNTIQLPNANLEGPLTTGCKATGTGISNTNHMACQNGTKAHRNYAKSGGGNNGSDYLDDVAAELYDMDLRPDLRNASEAANAKNNVVTYAIGFADPNLDPKNNAYGTVFADAAKAGGGQFFYAADSATLAAALDSVIADISTKVGSSASVATNSTQVSGNSLIYQAKFDSNFGDLNAYAINATTGGLGALQWNAGKLIPSASARTILTYNFTSKGTTFDCAHLSAAQKGYLGGITDCTSTDNQAIWRLNWLRGDKSHEEINTQRVLATGETEGRSTDQSVAVLRNRTRLDVLTNHAQGGVDPWVLGDIVNSSPVYVAAEDYGYSAMTGYIDFVLGKKDWTPMLYVGANDGMLHGFVAGTPGTPGTEVVAYVPDAVYPNLQNLTSPGYSHHYFVDGSPAVGDAYLGSAWHTVLVGTTGGGAKAAFALDVTNPTSFSGSDVGSKVLWEVSDTQSPTPSDVTSDTDTLRGFANNLGYTLSQAAIVRMKDSTSSDGIWVALIANGYESVKNRAVLYIVSLADGHIIKALNPVNAAEADFDSTAAHWANGLSTPFAADVNGDTFTDYIYAGDLRGNLWKFDVTSATAADWKVANNGAPLYVACDDSEVRTCAQAHRQPITSRPVVGVAQPGHTSGYMVYFGTGKYFEKNDNSLPGSQAQTFYAILDDGAVVPSGAGDAGLTRSNLVEQSITATITQGGNNWRTSTANGCADQGWFMNLPSPGERIIAFPQLRGDRLLFTTLVPLAPPLGADACSTVSSGTGWLMEMSAICGTPVKATLPPWDVNGDGVIDSTDVLLADAQGKNGQAPSGMQSTEGIPTAPAILILDPLTKPNRETKYIGGSTGGIQTISETYSSGNADQGRQSWTQIH